MSSRFWTTVTLIKAHRFATCVIDSSVTHSHFPAYAPDLNPDEGVWALLKGKLANGCPDDLQDLARQLQEEFRHLAGSQPKLRG